MKSLTIGACLALAPLSAQAEGFEGASLGFEITRYDDGEGFTVTSADLTADASYAITPDIGVQLALGLMEEVDSSDPFLDFRQIRSIGLHGWYDVSDQTRLGILITSDNYTEDAMFYGLEFVHLAGDLRLEGRIGQFDSPGETVDLYALYADFDFAPRAELRGFFRHADYGEFGHYRVTSVGIGYDVTPAAKVYLDYGFHENNFGLGDVYNGNLISVGVDVALGGPRNEKMFTYTPFY